MISKVVTPREKSFVGTNFFYVNFHEDIKSRVMERYLVDPDRGIYTLQDKIEFEDDWESMGNIASESGDVFIHQRTFPERHKYFLHTGEMILVGIDDLAGFLGDYEPASKGEFYNADVSVILPYENLTPFALKNQDISEN
ncbi:MAG: hypothetical protein ABIH72_03815 [archaeon]